MNTRRVILILVALALVLAATASIAVAAPQSPLAGVTRALREAFSLGEDALFVPEEFGEGPIRLKTLVDTLAGDASLGAANALVLFAQTSDTERIDISGASICKGERTLLGVYSASVDLQAESARLVFSGDLRVEELISHRVPLEGILEGIHLALHPGEESLKIVVEPQR